MTECARSAVNVSPDVAAEWLRKAGMVEDLRDMALKDLDRWITERCKEKGAGCADG